MALMMAAYGHVDIVWLLLSNNANIDIKCHTLFQCFTTNTGIDIEKESMLYTHDWYQSKDKRPTLSKKRFALWLWYIENEMNFIFFKQECGT